MGARLPRANFEIGTLTNAEIATQGQAIVNGLTAAVLDFPTPTIPVATLQGLVNDYNTALAASIGGSAQQRAAMHTARAALEAAIRTDGQYVNITVLAQIFTGMDYAAARLLIISSGYQVSTDPSPIGPLPQPVIKKFNSPATGQLYVLVIKVRGAKTYTLNWRLTGSSPDTAVQETFPNTRILKTDFTPGMNITFGVFANGTAGSSPESNQESQIII